ncbi:YecA/YgfB family protein [Niveispirillum cyanobacteriorum]|uniref:YecA family protein n=1 Tax=Niveispirillum cyanobacteriorum TaxID=1612173 RepID=A0A2K9NL59_9PROT|nr:YecA family protein [Niveispirillum cyanobacteriorum]AUN33791.1 YecA family protein [Niveispirillum cyanobacteriorum]GGE82792.1 hypothetical protein GCM10011317_45040 [Niveispirillum cyanobacteriorum]
MTDKPRLIRETRRIGPEAPMPVPGERPRLSDAELGAYLRSRGAAAAVNSLSGLDGYLTAIHVGPKFIDPRIWVADLAGEHAMMAAEGTQDGLAMQALVHHFNRISVALSDAPDQYRPWFDTDRSSKPDPLFWELGFYSGISLAKRSWSQVTNPSKPGRPIFDRLYVPLENKKALSPDIDRIVAKAVLGLREYFMPQRLKALR